MGEAMRVVPFPSQTERGAEPRSGRSALSRSAPTYAELAAMSNFSFLRGASHADEMVAQARALGLSAIAIADRNSLAGVVRAHTAAKQAGLRCLVGARIVVDGWPEMVWLPTDRRAYGRLSRMLSDGQMRAEKGACHLTPDDLAMGCKGQIIIVLPPDHWPRTASQSAPAVDASMSLGPQSAHHPAEATDFERQLASVKRHVTDARCVYLAALCSYRGQDRIRIAALLALAARQNVPLVASNAPVFQIGRAHV